MSEKKMSGPEVLDTVLSLCVVIDSLERATKDLRKIMRRFGKDEKGVKGLRTKKELAAAPLTRAITYTIFVTSVMDQAIEDLDRVANPALLGD